MRPSLLTWLCTSLSAGLPRWSFSRSLSLFVKLVSGDFAAVCSRSASLLPATELRSARSRASVCSGPCCESSSGPSVLTFALVESRQFSAQPRSLPETSSRRRVSFMSAFHLGHFLIELEMQILLLFSLKSHAPCAVERQCLIPKAATQSCW